MKVLYKRGKLIYLIVVDDEHYIVHLINRTNYKIDNPNKFIKQGYVEEANVDDETYKEIENIYSHGTHINQAVGALN